MGNAPNRKKASSGTRTARKPSKQTGSERRFPVLYVVFGGIAVLLVAAIIIGFGAGGGEFGDPAVAGDGLPLYTGDPETDPAIGLTYPTITGADFNGNPVTIEPNGTPKAILFLAHWCGVCQAEVPAVQAWINEGRLPDGVEIVSVTTLSSSARQNYPPSEWLEREGWTAPVLVDSSDNDVSTAFGLTGTPFWVFTDGTGNVVLRSSGLTDIPVLEGFLTLLAAGGAGE
jgi:hypothetical protein